MKKILDIRGMVSENCAIQVKQALEELTAVSYAEVDLRKGSATVKLSREIDDYHLTEAVDDAGYDLVEIEEI